MDGRFAGRTAVITGGASGIGLAIARRYLVEGGRVVANDINPERVAALAAEDASDTATSTLGKGTPVRASSRVSRPSLSVSAP